MPLLASAIYLSGKPLTSNSIEWSMDGQLAVTKHDSISIYTPTFRKLSLDPPYSFDCREIHINDPTSTTSDDENANDPSSYLPESFRQTCWSPTNALDHNCLLLTCTTQGRVLLYGSDKETGKGQDLMISSTSMTTSIAWSKSCFDNASLISLGLKDGEIVLGKYHGSPAAFEQILQVQVFDDNEEWVVGMTWSDWYTIDANSSVALVAVGGNKGSVILLQVFATQYDENSLTVLTGAADCICPRDPFKFTPSMILKFYNDMSNGHARLALAREDSVHVWDCAFRGNQQQQQLLLTKTRVGEPFTSPHIMEIGGIAWDYCSGQSLHIFSVSGVCKTLDLPRIASATNDPQVIVTDISDRIHYFALKPPFASTTNDQDEENAITDIANGTTIKTHQQSGIFQMDINDFELIKVVDMARNAEPVQVFSGIGNTKLFPRFFGADTSGSSCFIALHYQTASPLKIGAERAINNKGSCIIFLPLESQVTSVQALLPGSSSVWKDNVITRIDSLLCDPAMLIHASPRYYLWDLIAFMEAEIEMLQAPQVFGVSMATLLPQSLFLRLLNVLQNRATGIDTTFTKIDFQNLGGHALIIDQVSDQLIKLIFRNPKLNALRCLGYLSLQLQLSLGSLNKTLSDSDQSVAGVVNLLRRLKELHSEMYYIIYMTVASAIKLLVETNQVDMSLENYAALRHSLHSIITYLLQTPAPSFVTLQQEELNHRQNVLSYWNQYFLLYPSSGTCAACHASFVPLTNQNKPSWLEKAVCQNGHVWDRCGLTLLPITSSSFQSCMGCQQKFIIPTEQECALLHDWMRRCSFCAMCGDRLSLT